MFTSKKLVGGSGVCSCHSSPVTSPFFLNKLPSTPLTTLCLHLTLDYSFLFFPKPPVNNRKPEVRELEVLYIGGGSEPGKGEK